MTDYDDPNEYDLAREDAAARQRARRLNAHPDCRDPDHPGCEHCDDPQPEDDENAHP